MQRFWNFFLKKYISESPVLYEKARTLCIINLTGILVTTALLILFTVLLNLDIVATIAFSLSLLVYIVSLFFIYQKRILIAFYIDLIALTIVFTFYTCTIKYLVYATYLLTSMLALLVLMQLLIAFNRLQFLIQLLLNSLAIFRLNVWNPDLS